MSVKLCKGCEQVKPLEGGFYKAGKSWQKYCKMCHNKKRYEFKMTPKKYTPRPKGFMKLPKETQDKIIYDTYVKVNYKEIAKKYKLSYYTLMSWKKKGLIPEYEPPTTEAHQHNTTASEPADHQQ